MKKRVLRALALLMLLLLPLLLTACSSREPQSITGAWMHFEGSSVLPGARDILLLQEDGTGAAYCVSQAWRDAATGAALTLEKDLTDACPFTWAAGEGTLTLACADGGVYTYACALNEGMGVTILSVTDTATGSTGGWIPVEVSP